MPVFLTGCGKTMPKNQKPDQKNNSKKTVSQETKNNQSTDTSYIDPSGEEIVLGVDTNQFHVDTMVTIGEVKLVVGKNKKGPNGQNLSIDDLEFEPIIVSFYAIENDSMIYREKFEENQFVHFYKFQNNTLHYISLSSYGGGSGYTSTIYKIQTSAKPELKPVMHYEELTSYMFNKEGTEIIRMQGIWDMSEESDESHFSDHRYEISVLNILENKTSEKHISTTIHKYPSADVDFSSKKLLGLIRAKEPQVFEGTKLDTYSL